VQGTWRGRRWPTYCIARQQPQEKKTMHPRGAARLAAAFLTTVALSACQYSEVGGEDQSGTEGRQPTALSRCTVAGEQVSVRTCYRSAYSGNIYCYVVASVFRTQSIPSVMPLAELSLPADSSAKLLATRLENLGLIDKNKDLPDDLDAFNETIRAVDAALDKSSSTCKAGTWRVGAVDGLTSAPKGIGFICGETTSGDTLLECDDPSSVKPFDYAYASPSSQTINGVAFSFHKTGCGAYQFSIDNLEDSVASYSSSVSGILLAPPCSGTLSGADRWWYSPQACSVDGIKGGGQRVGTYTGKVTRGGTSLPFSFTVTVRCD
jgi:hypothetical protein